jgi:hypothetical protein
MSTPFTKQMEEQDKQPRIKWLKKLERGPVTSEDYVGDTLVQRHDIPDKRFENDASNE